MKNINDDYGWQSEDAPHSFKYITPKLISIISQLGAGRILDLGAGNGAICRQLKDLRYDIVGVEIDQRGIELARKASPDIKFYNFSVDDDPELLVSKEEKFEVVISTEVIEHLYAPHDLLRYAGAVLVENGILILSTPYHGYMKNLALSVLNRWDSHFTVLRFGGHIKFFSRNTLTKLLDEYGFDVVGFAGVGRFPYLWKSMIVTARKRSGF